MTRIFHLSLVVALLAAAGTATAQTASPPAQPTSSAATPPRTYQEMWGALVGRIADLRKTAPLNLADQIGELVDVNRNVEPFLLFAHAQSVTTDLRAIESARTDKQLGAPPVAGGSTSLISKGSVPRILAFAVEHGAATQSNGPTSATVRGNAIGWLDLVREQGFLPSAYQSPAERYLRKVSYSFTFDVTPAIPETSEQRPTTEQIKALVDTNQRQLTAYSVRVSFVDQRDPRRDDNRASGQLLLGGREGSDLLGASSLMDPVVTKALYRNWLDEAQIALSGPGEMSNQDVERVLYVQLEQLRQIMIREIPQFDRGVARFVKALRSFEGAQLKWFDDLQQRFVLAAELVRTRPPSEAGTMTYRLVGEGHLGSTALDLTLNAALTRQDSGTAMVPEPKGTAGWRDLQFGLQVELPIGRRALRPDDSGVGRPTFAIEYLSRKLFDAAVVTFAGHDFSVEPGWIHAAQAKVTIPMKSSGVKIPISVSIANRTELLAEKTVRGHIGLTFDLDALTSAVRR